VPLTVIATIGAINALNMIDGIDGLSGSLSIVSLLLIAVAVYLSGDAAYFSLVIVMAAGWQVFCISTCVTSVGAVRVVFSVIMAACCWDLSSLGCWRICPK
jgi:UDP-N-acetylmuramyl pentapeptide phosphotransferase/UDP-N-acetylglucosamine-1-phosphate transferase